MAIPSSFRVQLLSLVFQFRSQYVKNLFTDVRITLHVTYIFEKSQKSWGIKGVRMAI